MMIPFHRAARFVIVACLGLVLAPQSITPAAELPHVPEGFTVQVVAAPPLVQHPTLACFDEQGRLYVCESAGTNRKSDDLIAEPLDSIRRLEDTDGDGIFDSSITFADKLTFPQGCLWYRGALYTCSPPHVWKLTDTDDDGVCDEREIFVSSFGFNGNAADIHGPFLGIDGRIYWCDGRHGHEFLDEGGNVTSTGKAARIFSCRPDGSDIRTFCGGGMDNPVEIDWLDSGEMIGTVNLFYGRPRGDCLVHWVEGGVYPRHDQEDCIAEFPWTGGLLPEVHNYGHVAVSGMCRQRSDQLFDLPGAANNVTPASGGRQSPDESGVPATPDCHAFFVTQFNTHKVVRTIIEREGATFRHVRTDDFITWDDPDVHPTDVFEDADGSLLVIDTGGWFRIGCPTSQIAKPEIPGAIYRVRKQGSHNISNPRGLNVAWSDLSIEDLFGLLDDERPVVRRRAIDELAQRDPEDVLDRTVDLLFPDTEPRADDDHVVTSSSPATVTARIGALWAVRQLSDVDNGDLTLGTEDAALPVRLVALAGLAARGTDDVFPSLGWHLKSESAAERRAGFDALAGLMTRGPNVFAGYRHGATVMVLMSLDQHADRRDHVELHAAVHALQQFSLPDSLRRLLSAAEAGPEARRAVLIAVDQMKGADLKEEDVVSLLETDHVPLQQAALEVITRHPGWADGVVERIGEWLSEEQLSPDRVSAVRALLAAQAESERIQQLIAEGLMAERMPEHSQLVLLEAMDEAELDEWPDSWTTALEQSVRSPESSIRLGALALIGRKGLESFNETLQARAEDAGIEPAERIEAFAAVAPRLDSVSRGLFQFLGKQLVGDGDLLEKLTIARGLAAAPLDDDQLCLVARSFAEIGPATVPVLLPAFERSQTAVVGEQLVIHLQELGDSLSISPAELERLLERYPEEVRQRSEPLLKVLQGDLAEQEGRLAHLMSVVTQPGDVERGRGLFFSKQAACSSCHRIKGEGAAIGPDLSNIGAIRQPRDLLEAIAFPSASFAREYRPYTVLTKTGRVYAGIIGRQTKETLTLRQADLTEVRIPRKEVEVMREADTSIMPRGLDTKLPESDLRDLIGYLSAQR